MQTTFKKIGLRTALAAALAVVAVSSHAVEGTATATGTVIQPIAIGSTANLNFGKFTPGAGGSITVSTSGAPTVSGVVRSSTVATTAAKFDVTGDANATYAITYTGTSADLADAVTPTPNKMALAIVSDLTAGNKTVTGTADTVASGNLGAGSAQSIYVGGKLTVAATQPSGTYTGSIKVQVEYN